ncbi:hypothetical protein BJ875DRAFT_440402 [Amylocarpus encephaloides]|uniref:Uncharacterized protein n=1 Tax=Amylocarpus encephaloides TaxID=45428 RepID=A0A9P7YKF4_9HELO|nr:hypothetical protein BJ875DRAFT_440402 [Amylocarpus encephaloides]
MASSLKLDTSTDVLERTSGNGSCVANDSARNSYASATDSDGRTARSSYAESRSPRSSYGSIMGTSPRSSRTSYSSLRDSFGRVASFSRTSDSFVPETPSGSQDSPPGSPTNWISKTESESTEKVVKDGPTVLRSLQNVQTVHCVAFGVFDRYYISWEDTNNQFYQGKLLTPSFWITLLISGFSEHNKLPESLCTWLFPGSGETRHIPSLQVSFGSNDDFFASDRFGKTSSRDAAHKVDESKPVSRLAELAREMINQGRPQMETEISNKPVTEGSIDGIEISTTPRSDRRRTFAAMQSAPLKIEDKLVKKDAGEIFANNDPTRYTTTTRRKAHTVSSPGLPPENNGGLGAPPKLERRRTFMGTQSAPMKIEAKLATIAAEEEQRNRISTDGTTNANQRRRRSVWVRGAKLASQKLESKNQGELDSDMEPLEKSGSSIKTEERLAKTVAPVVDIKDMEAKAAPGLEGSRDSIRHIPASLPSKESGPILDTREAIPVAIGDRPLQSRARPTERIHARRRSGFLSGVPIKLPPRSEVSSWRETREALARQATYSEPPRHHTTAICPLPAAKGYVSTGVQTEPERFIPFENAGKTPPTYNYTSCESCLPPQHHVAIGSMQDFFRGEYSLGDALRYV